MERIQRGRKNNPYNGNFNNDNKTYLPARTTTLGYEKTESIKDSLGYVDIFIYSYTLNVFEKNTINSMPLCEIQ